MRLIRPFNPTGQTPCVLIPAWFAAEVTGASHDIFFACPMSFVFPTRVLTVGFAKCADSILDELRNRPGAHIDLGQE